MSAMDTTTTTTTNDTTNNDKTATTNNKPTTTTGTSISSSTSATAKADSCVCWEEKIQLVRKHYIKKGYRVHSGLQFGCELVLYADDPSKVHSDFCIHVVRDDGFLDWREIQTLVRSMSDFRKTLILANVVVVKKNGNGDNNDKNDVIIEELAMTTEHAPFRHKPKLGEVGSQRKRQKISTSPPTNNKDTTATTTAPTFAT